MKRFDIREYEVEELIHSLKETLHNCREELKGLPPKIIEHEISIRYKTGENSCSWNGSMCWTYDHKPFKTRKEAEDFLNKNNWLVKTGDNMWVEEFERNSYIDKDGNEVKCHFEIYEYDYETYADHNTYYEYTKEEEQMLRESLRAIEVGLAHMRAYDDCSDNYSFGKGRYVETVQEYLKEMEENYSEENQIEEDD